MSTSTTVTHPDGTVITVTTVAAAAAAAGDAVPRHPLNSGHAIPALGLGTFLATKPGEVGAAVKAAIAAGYRLIDCAAGYGNQTEIGEALAEVFAEGVVKREDLFIVSKLFQTHHSWEGDDSRCHETLNQTLAELQLDYLDLFLIHWPFAFGEKKLEKPPGTKQPLRLPDGSPNPIWTIRMEYTKTWASMEGMVAAGKCKSIGVSNFTIAQLEHLRSVAKVPPAVNQVELHPYFQQREMMAYCAANGMVVMGFSPLGSSADRFPEAHGCTLLSHPTVRGIAEAAGRSAGQVLIRYGMQANAASKAFVSIPKSTNAGRIAENFDVLGWELSADAMKAMEGLECDFRYFISYMKKPDNEVRWHGDKGCEEFIEKGDDSDFVGTPPASL